MIRLGPTCTGCCVRSITYNQWQAVHIRTTISPGNDKYKILWHFNVKTDKFIEHMRPDMVCIVKQKRQCQIFDFAIPGDQNMAIKEQEKIDKYYDLRIELQKV